ncbi:glycosyltransferase involved in cell wall biosynthesis [Acetoanaerobium pronyense]|uniref:Glycosyltransferase involved in cell wall biosynthesis n=1 Tax=Acetoanaerobium pronyense TaxID=1482736 RepID=A0ABS4KKP2_9FIRM|nr:glycosyltransferase family 4 protein [Acetoanaerobium pronyense]MBP2027199.1 glycosyltransferase involved in cell wall biosynthesis [Acetoanaerobium pronyense]
MKILMVNKFLYNRGGAETYAFELAQYQQSLGYEVQFFGMEDPQNIHFNEVGLYTKNLEFKGFSVSQITYPFRIIYSNEARKKIRKILNNFKPDYVHLNNINFQLTPSIIYEIKSFGIPIIQTLHDFQLVCPNHMMYREHDDVICEDCKGRNYKMCFKNKCIHGSRVKSLLGAIEGRLYYNLKTYEKIDSFISPSRFLKNKMVEFGEDEKNIHVIHNFIKRDYEYAYFEKKDYILYFGRLSVQKGIRTLLEVAKELKDVQFVIAGGGELEEEVVKASQEASNIKFVGFQTGENLINLIGKAKLSVLPTQWYENCPMSILESFMLGTPVIGSEIGGVPELIRNEIDGFLFEPKDKNGLKEAILKALRDDDLLKSMSKSAKERLEDFSIESYHDKLMDIVKPLL